MRNVKKIKSVFNYAEVFIHIEFIYLLFILKYLFIVKELQREKTKKKTERRFYNYRFTSQMVPIAGTEPGQSRSQELQLSHIGAGTQTPGPSSAALPRLLTGNRLEVKQLRHKPASLWDVHEVAGGFTHCTKFLTPILNLIIGKMTYNFLKRFLTESQSYGRKGETERETF